MTAEFGEARLAWTAGDEPRSLRFDDIYFSAEDGLAESRAVFLEGCGLPQAWRGRPHFTLGELGFGTGLNVLATLDLWRRTRAPGQRLSIFSVEAFPLAAAEAARALAAWPELSELARALIAAWPRRAPGFHRLTFPALDASLDLAFGEAAWGLEQWTGRADAWFLDGFSPARNPRMWRPEVLAGVARRSAPGARAATFTVAGAVRRALEAEGFDLAKRPGHGRKRERLEGRLAGARVPDSPPRRIAVIGAGIGGAALARALAALGARPLALEAERPGAGASGNRAALVGPALDAGGGARAAFYAQALARARDLYEATGDEAVIGRGLLQLERLPRDKSRFDKVAASGLFDPDRLERLDAAAASAWLGWRLGAGALLFRDGVTVRPAAVLDAWLAPAERRQAKIARLERRGPVWRMLGETGESLGEAEAVCIAAGWGAHALCPNLPLSPVRGQASWAPGAGLAAAAAWSGYATPVDGGLLFGASHARGSAGTEVLAADHRGNLERLAEALPELAAAIDPSTLQGWTGVRAAAPDRMPLAGALAEGLYVLGGLGSRGFATAPLLAEHLAALICGTPSPLPADLQRIVDPARFASPGPPQDDRKA